MILTRQSAYVFAVCMILATALMEYALLTNDFSVSYVAQVGSLATPTVITIVSLWSALEGSILLWALFLGVFTLIFAYQSRKLDLQQSAYSLGVLLAICVFFAFLVASLANPFAPMEQVPKDGPGPNPLLQNHPLMIIHPPSLYAGFVGMSVPFAIGAGALMAGRLDVLWMRLLQKMGAGHLELSDPGHSSWRLVVLRGPGLGRILGLGPRRERIVHALAYAHGLHAHSAMVTERRKMFSAGLSS